MNGKEELWERGKSICRKMQDRLQKVEFSATWKGKEHAKSNS